MTLILSFSPLYYYGPHLHPHPPLFTQMCNAESPDGLSFSLSFSLRHITFFFLSFSFVYSHEWSSFIRALYKCGGNSNLLSLSLWPTLSFTHTLFVCVCVSLSLSVSTRSIFFLHKNTNQTLQIATQKSKRFTYFLFILTRKEIFFPPVHFLQIFFFFWVVFKKKKVVHLCVRVFPPQEIHIDCFQHEGSESDPHKKCFFTVDVELLLFDFAYQPLEFSLFKKNRIFSPLFFL